MERVNEVQENNGTIKISEDAIATITSVAVMEIDGVCSLSGSIAGEIAHKLGKKNSTKGIKVTNGEDEVVIDINIVVKYGVRIPEVAWNVQDNVKKSVESMSGLNVTKVNVHVCGVDFAEDSESDAE